MKQENESGSIPAEKPAATTPAGSIEAITPPLYETAAGITVNFHSAEFNHTDDLNDNSGNYRCFQPLDGVVTADMRHQMERGHNREAIASFVDDAAPLKKMELESKQAEALEALPPLTVISHGRTLIVATDAERAIACGKLLTEQGLTCTLLVIQNASSDAPFSRLGRLALLTANALSITGAFGGFSATATVKGDQKHLTEWFEKEEAAFDLVLDLQSTPSFAGDCLPLGYYAPGTNPLILEQAMAELPEMRGRFQKPQFIAFLKNRCIHGRSRTRDCRHCLEVCPFGAIQSVDKKISINHYLCQGCGGCALVCPADAIRMIQPSTAELLNMLRGSLENRSAGAASSPTLVISDRETADANERLDRGEGSNDHRVNFKVEHIAHVGLEMLLAAAAFGADRVVVACGPQNPPKIGKAVAWQAHMADALLQGLGKPAGTIRCTASPLENNDAEKPAFPAAGLDAQSDNSPMPPAAFPLRHDKRTLVYLAMQCLYERSGVQKPWLPLPPGSPFGAVAVDSAACTLCMACAAACPSGALSTGGEVPRIALYESRCHQCGLCEEACPEGAIQLLPRIRCGPQATECPALLHEVEPFRCIKCGAPFATQTMINRMQDKLRGHWMYADDRQLRRLQMCRTCRARDTLSSQDMNVWNQ